MSLTKSIFTITMLIGILISSMSVFAHYESSDETLECHTTCAGSSPSYANHKHPNGDCEALEFCPTAELVPEQRVKVAGYIKVSDGKNESVNTIDDLILAANGWWTHCWAVIGNTTYIDTRARSSQQCHNSLSQCTGMDVNSFTSYFNTSPVLQNSRYVTKCR